MKSYATFCILEERPLILGYTKTDRLWRLVLKPAHDPPAAHKCCLSSEMNSISFWDVSIYENTMLKGQILNVQQLFGGDNFRLSNRWTGALPVKNRDEQICIYDSEVISVGDDACAIVGRLFPTLKESDCLVSFGLLELDFIEV